jgi:multiple sugar transport system ATP-binding protein
MRAGLLQQVGPPQELYDHPANLFVAGFIGSPAMNFLPATIEGDRLHSLLGELPLEEELRQSLESRNGTRQVIVGIRPESFEDASLVSADARSRGITFTAPIDVIESLGSDVYAYFSLEGGERISTAELEELARDSGQADTGGTGAQVIARLDAATRLREGAQAELWADAAAIHVFDPSSGQNVSLARTPTPA